MARFLPIVRFSKVFILVKILSLVSLVVVPIMCTQVLDIKVIIALSSVAHIGLGLLAVSFAHKIGLLAFIFIILRHGFSSSLIFLFRFLIYKRVNTRRLLRTKGLKERSVFIWGI